MKIDGLSKVILHCPICGEIVRPDIESMTFTRAGYEDPSDGYRIVHKPTFWVKYNLEECEHCQTRFSGEMIVPRNEVMWGDEDESRVD